MIETFESSRSPAITAIKEKKFLLLKIRVIAAKTQVSIVVLVRLVGTP